MGRRPTRDPVPGAAVKFDPDPRQAAIISGMGMCRPGGETPIDGRDYVRNFKEGT